VLGHNCASKNN